MAEIIDLDATEQLAALAAGHIGAVELLRLAIEQAEASRALNAVVAHDLDRAVAEAAVIDQRRAQGQVLGRLAGLPMTVKDTLDVEGLPGSAGMSGLLGRHCTDAEVVRRVRAEGAVVWGKTNTPVKAADWQTYNSLYGVTNHPRDPRLTPGGSSGGSAAALAAGITALEIGADIGGSLRIPAGFCGVFAHKPSYGLVSQRGLVPPPGAAAELDLAVVGPMARSARDLSLLLSVIADWRPAGPKPLKGLRVGLWLDEPAFVLDTEVRSVIDAFAAGLAERGALIEPVGSPVAADRLMFTYTSLLFSLTGADLPPAERSLYEALRWPAKAALAMGAGPLSWAQGVLAYTARHADWLKAHEERARIITDMDAFFGRYDVLLTPVAPVVAFPHDHRPMLRRRLRTSEGGAFSYLKLMEWPALATVAGLPATAVPAGEARGLPVGVQIVGPPGGDALTLGVAMGWEAGV